MCSTVEYKMWPNDSSSNHPLLAPNAKGTRGPSMPRNSLGPLKSTGKNSDLVPEPKPRKVRDYSSILKNPKRAPVKNRDRTFRAPGDVLLASDLDPLTKRKAKVDRKIKKTKKDPKLFPGGIYREKTFGVFSTPNTKPFDDFDNLDRPSNVPRRRVQNEESDVLDRAYVTERPRSFIEEKRSFNSARSLRPKSAGQALYAADSDDDSSLEGDIEYIDIENDDAFFLGYDDDSYMNETPKRDTTGDNKNGKQQEMVGHANRYHDNPEDISRQSDQLYVSESEKLDDGIIYADDNDGNQTSLERFLAPGGHDRRRAKSDSAAISLINTSLDKRRESEVIQRDVEKAGFVRKANSLNKKPQSISAKNETLHADMCTEKAYAKAVEKVLTKYSNLSVNAGDKRSELQADLGTVRPSGGQASGNTAAYGMRTSMPRKLKPLLNREKMGQVNQDRTTAIDYQVPFS